MKSGKKTHKGWTIYSSLFSFITATIRRENKERCGGESLWRKTCGTRTAFGTGIHPSLNLFSLSFDGFLEAVLESRGALMKVLPGALLFLHLLSLMERQAVTKDLTSSTDFSGSCVLTLQTLLQRTRPWAGTVERGSMSSFMSLNYLSSRPILYYYILFSCTAGKKAVYEWFTRAPVSLFL